MLKLCFENSTFGSSRVGRVRILAGRRVGTGPVGNLPGRVGWEKTDHVEIVWPFHSETASLSKAGLHVHYSYSYDPQFEPNRTEYSAPSPRKINASNNSSAICQLSSTVRSASSPQNFWDPCIFCRRTNSLEFTAWSLSSCWLRTI